MKTLAFLYLAAFGAYAQPSATNTLTINVPAGATITVAAPDVTQPIDPTRQPLPSQNIILPMSVQMRMAAQLARGKAAPWCQRLIVVNVEEFPLTVNEEDDAGLPNGKAHFTTNFLVSVVATATPGDTNASPVVWGPVKNKIVKFMTARPTRKGDEYDVFPVEQRTP